MMVGRQRLTQATLFHHVNETQSTSDQSLSGRRARSMGKVSFTRFAAAVKCYEGRVSTRSSIVRGKAMSTVFKEFLQQQAKKHQAEAPIIDEWRLAIQRLFIQIRQWLKDSDPDGGLIEVKENQEDVTEPGLGRYRVPRLDIRAFGKWIGIIPKARKTVTTAQPPQKSAPERAEGRVDITDELRRYVLYRFRQDGRDLWLIDALAPEKSWPGEVQFVPKAEPKELNQEAFERALMSYLQ
jgi:hypothetical protein